jgi:hypothetical protein
VTDLTRTIERRLLAFRERGRAVVVRVTAEGVYLKAAGRRWSNAVLLPWGAAWSVACKMEVDRKKRERAQRRRAGRGGR